MSNSMCPHLVQEYFERVSEILEAYRPQILKQVEYDKISENLVMRGALRPEEHERIDKCDNFEGRVSQMLVVVQNRMWGLENLLAAFMEEHVSPWLTQEMFRGYMEHLVHPLKKQQESPQCNCVLMSNSVLYKGWVKTLKSLDSLILRAGNSLGFMRQTMYPTDNMLAFLSDKLAEYTGGDSMSKRNDDDLVPYGFAPNASGEVQVAELEEDDINDLIALSETLSITYSNGQEKIGSSVEEPLAIDALAILNKVEQSKVLQSKSDQSQPKSMKSGVSPTLAKPELRRSLREKRGSDRVKSKISEEVEAEEKDKLQTQRQKLLIDRLSAPKSVASTSSTSSSVRLRNSNSGDGKLTPTPTTLTKTRPRSAELHRSASISTPTSTSTVKSISPSTPTSNAKTEKKPTTSGKTSGFVRSKSIDPSSVKPKLTRSSSTTRPTAVTKPNPKTGRGNVKQEETLTLAAEKISKKDCMKSQDVNATPTSSHHSVEAEPDALKPVQLFPAPPPEHDLDHLVLPEMSSLLLCNSGLSSDEDHQKNLGYYQLNFDI